MGQLLSCCPRRGATEASAKVTPAKPGVLDRSDDLSNIAVAGPPITATAVLSEVPSDVDKQKDLERIQLTTASTTVSDVELPDVPVEKQFIPPPATFLDLPPELLMTISEFISKNKRSLCVISKSFFKNANFTAFPRNELILEACRRGYAAWLNLVLVDEENVATIVDENDKTATFLPVIPEQLLEKLSSIYDRCKMTIFHHSVESGNAETVKFWIDLFSKTANPNLELLEKLLNSQDVWKCVPMHRCRTAEIATLLTTVKATDPQNKSKEIKIKPKLNLVTRADVKDTLIQAGDSVGHVAVRYDKPEMLQALIDQMKQTGLDLNISNRNGDSPLDIAVDLKMPACGSLLVKANASRAQWSARKMTWYQAVETKMVFVVEYMKTKGLAAPGGVNFQQNNSTGAPGGTGLSGHQGTNNSETGEAALHLACSSFSSEDGSLVVPLVAGTTGVQHTAVHPIKAIDTGVLVLDPEICKILLDSKADATLRDKSGQTALHKACVSMRNVLGCKDGIKHCHKDHSQEAANKMRDNEKKVLQTCDFLLKANPRTVAYQDNEKCSALMLAAGSGSLELLKLLISYCSATNLERESSGVAGAGATSTSTSSTPTAHQSDLSPSKLPQNSRSQDPEKLILESRDVQKRNLLHYACTFDNVEVVKFLMENYILNETEHPQNTTPTSSTNSIKNRKLLTTAVDERERIPFMTAIVSRARNVLQYFLELEKQRPTTSLITKQVDQQLQTPLMLACGDAELVEILLKDEEIMNSEMIEEVDWEGRNACHISCQLGDVESLRLLTEVMDRKYSDESENVAGSELLLNNTMDWGWTCLMLACDKGSLECIEFLLQTGKEKDVDMAAPASETSSTSKILNQLNARRSDGCTAMLVLGKTDQISTGDQLVQIWEKILLQAEDKNQKPVSDLILFQLTHDKESSSSRTLLHFVAQNPHIEVNSCHTALDFLLAKGADVNAKDSVNWTALHYCCQKGDLLSVEVLFKYNAVDSEDDVGVSARSLAEKCGHHHLLNAFPGNVNYTLNATGGSLGGNSLGSGSSPMRA
ncbi:unnamed protein product [Amoebophrya sp. A120]|nr:unnamed protein product [Amoebophrya sp. A120]|eukprot:GSA120T00004665001.1